VGESYRVSALAGKSNHKRTSRSEFIFKRFLVVDESEMTREAVSARTHQDATIQLTPVFFYGTYNYAWIPTQNLFSFHENVRFLPVAKDSSVWLNTAIQEAMDVRLGEERFGMVRQVLEIQEQAKMRQR